jgi:hypothetical protein
LKKVFIYFLPFFFVACAISTTNALATSYLLHDSFGGTYFDAEKSANNSEDDLMCWAASTANVLAWTGWGYPSRESFTTEDDIFQYFQNHWTDGGGSIYYGLDWWFDGENDLPGTTGVSQVDVSGGGFWSGETFSNYYKYFPDNSSAMENIKFLSLDGYGISLAVFTDEGRGHAITAWGYEYDEQGDYAGVYVTDSDDDNRSSLEYYGVIEKDNAWFLQDFYGVNTWYISEVHGLAQYISAVPEPTTLILFGLGILGLVGMDRKKI